ncbi:MAG: CPBP family intramembrane glutamic endopeptidase [Candidatus Omnitrophota bacterium]
MLKMEFSKIRNFIAKERLYIFLLAFIIAANLIVAFTGGKEERAEAKPSKIRAMLERRKDLSQQDIANTVLKDKRLRLISTIFSLSIMLAITLGLFFFIIVCMRKRDGETLIVPTVVQGAPGWGIWDACKVAILIVSIGHMIAILESALAGVFPGIAVSKNVRSVISATIADTLIFAFIIYFALKARGHRMLALGFSFKNFIRNCLYGIAGYLATIPVFILSLALVLWLVMLFKYEPPIQPVLEIFLEEKKTSVILYLGFFVSVAGPIVEELFFRGFLYQAIKKHFGVFNALVASSALFALLHANLTGFLPIMILGMLLAYLFERTGTLVAPVCVHVFHNSIMILFVMGAKEIYGKLGLL